MGQIEVLDCFGDVPGLFVVERPRFSFADRAKAAVPGADITTQHESRRAIGPALENIRTARFLADSMKVQAFDQLQYLILACRIAQADFKPGGLGLADFRYIGDYS